MRPVRPSSVVLITACLVLSACSSKDSKAGTATKPAAPAAPATAPATTPATTPPSAAATPSGLPAFSMPADKDLTTTKSGLKYQAVKMGTGAKPKANDIVTVNYTGWTTDGKMFDSTLSHGSTPTTYPANKFIAGWTEGLQLMPVGSVFKFVIPASLAYGANPPPGSGIPQNATLVFQVELLKIGG